MFNEKQKQIFIGSILGDGTIVNNWRHGNICRFQVGQSKFDNKNLDKISYISSNSFISFLLKFFMTLLFSSFNFLIVSFIYFFSSKSSVIDGPIWFFSNKFVKVLNLQNASTLVYFLFFIKYSSSSFISKKTFFNIFLFSISDNILS